MQTPLGATCPILHAMYYIEMTHFQCTSALIFQTFWLVLHGAHSPSAYFAHGALKYIIIIIIIIILLRHLDPPPTRSYTLQEEEGQNATQFFSLLSE